MVKKTRSRFGCNNCKRMKIKCDEIKPQCTNCSKSKKYFNKCDYAMKLSWGGRPYKNEQRKKALQNCGYNFSYLVGEDYKEFQRHCHSGCQSYDFVIENEAISQCYTEDKGKVKNKETSAALLQRPSSMRASASLQSTSSSSTRSQSTPYSNSPLNSLATDSESCSDTNEECLMDSFLYSNSKFLPMGTTDKTDILMRDLIMGYELGPVSPMSPIAQMDAFINIPTDFGDQFIES